MEIADMSDFFYLARIGGATPRYSFLPDDAVVIDLVVIPMWGLYANMIAQLISQISSHFIIHYHRHIVFVAAERH